MSITDSTPAERRARFLGLFVGAAAGQGSTVAAQALLVGMGYAALVGDLGYGLAILSLAMVISDWGAIYLLSRGAARDDYSQLSGAIVGRVPVAIVATIGAIAWAISAKSEIVVGVVVGGIPAVLLSPLNVVGYLDGKALSNRSGPLSSISWALSAAAMLLVALIASQHAGLFVGLAFSVGFAITLVGYCRLLTTGERSALLRPDMRQSIDLFQEGFHYMVGALPAQAYGRVVIGLVNAHLGNTVGGLYILARNVCVGVSQVVLLIRRAEFRTVAVAMHQGEVSLLRLVSVQKYSVVLSIGFVLVSGLLLLAAPILPDGLQAAIPILFLLALSVPLQSAGVVVAGILIACTETRRLGLITLSSIVVAIAITLGGIARFGIAAVVVAEAVMSTVQLLGFTATAKKVLARRDMLPLSSQV